MRHSLTNISHGVQTAVFIECIFISLSVRLQFFAALGKFHFAANNISIDCRVSGLIFVTFKDFLIKRVSSCSKRSGQDPIGFLPHYGVKVVFPSDKGISICQCTFRNLVTTHLQHGHELVHGVTLYGVLVTAVRVQIKGTLGRVDNDTGEILVLHWFCLVTCVL